MRQASESAWPNGRPRRRSSRCGHAGWRSSRGTSHLEDSVSPGSSILVSLVGEGCYIGGDSIGARGKPAESVGREASASFLTAFATGARVDVHLADMLGPVLCLSDSPSALLIPYVTEHLRTSLHVAKQFTSADHAFESRGEASLLSIWPARAK